MRFFRSLAQLFPRFARRSGALERAVRPSFKSRGLRLEPLENRELLAVDALAVPFGPPSLESVANETAPIAVSASVLADDGATLSVQTETAEPVAPPSFEQLMESLGQIKIESLDAETDVASLAESDATQTELQPSFIVDGVEYYPLSQAVARRVVFEDSGVDAASLDEPFVLVPPADADETNANGARSGGSGGDGETSVWPLNFNGAITSSLGALASVGIENALLERATTVSGGASVGGSGASGGDEIESLAPNYLQITLPEIPYAYEARVTFGGGASLGSDYQIYAPLDVFNQYYNAQTFGYSGGSTSIFVLPVNDGAPEALEDFTATLATPTPVVASGGSSFAQPYDFTFTTSNQVSATFVDDDHWKISVEASDPTATERLADVEQDYGYYTFKREHQNADVAEKIDAKLQEMQADGATEAELGAIKALADLVTGDATYSVTVDFEAFYNRESTYDAQPTVDYALSASPLASESANSYLTSFEFSSTPNQSEAPLWRYDCSGVIPASKTEALLRLNPIFDWLDEGELFDPNYLVDSDLDAATPDEQTGEKARLRLLDATWSGQGADYNPLGETLAEVAIKDGAIAELYFDYDADGTLDPYQSTADETCYVPLNDDDDNENDVEDRLETTAVANENDIISALAVAWVDALTCLTDGVYYVVDAFLNFSGTAISVFENAAGTTPYQPTDANGNPEPIFASSPTSSTYAAPVYLEGTDFGAANAVFDLDVSRVTDGETASTNIGPVVDRAITSTPYKVDVDVDSDNNGYINEADDDLEDTRGRSVVYFPSGTNPPDDYKEVEVSFNWSELDGDVNDYQIRVSTPSGIVIRSSANPSLTLSGSVNYLTLTEAAQKFYAFATAPNASSLAPVRVILEKQDDAGDWIPAVSDIIAFDVQDGSDAGGWIVPSGWRIGEDGSLTTPTPAEGAVGPQSEGSGVTTNKGAAYYELTSEQIAAGFEISFDYEFLRNGVGGYLQPDTNKNKQIDPEDTAKLSFVGNSGVKFGTAHTNLSNDDDVSTGVTEIAILDVEKSTALADGLEKFIPLIDDNTGETDLSSINYVDEPVTKLTSGVKYGAPNGNLLTKGYQAFFQKNYELFARQSVEMKLRYTGVNNDDANQNDKLIVYVKKQDGTYEKYGEYYDVFGAVKSQVKENRVYLQAHWGSGVKFSNIEFSALANE